MRKLYPFLVLLSLAWAQSLSGEPACALPCLTSAIAAAGCALDDIGCQCGSGQAVIQSASTSCLLEACNVADLASAASVGAALCQSYSATANSPQTTSPDIAQTSSTPAPTTEATTTQRSSQGPSSTSNSQDQVSSPTSSSSLAKQSSASKETSQQSTASKETSASTHDASKGSAATSSATSGASTQPAISTQHKSKNLAWIAGPVIGVIVLAAIGLGGYFLYKRRRRAKLANGTQSGYEGKPELHGESLPVAQQSGMEIAPDSHRSTTHELGWPDSQGNAESTAVVQPYELRGSGWGTVRDITELPDSHHLPPELEAQPKKI